MIEWLEYIIRVSVMLVIFYGFYRLAFNNEKTLAFNRFYLLGSLAASLILPAINPTVYLPAVFSWQQPEVVEYTTRTVMVPAGTMIPVEAATVTEPAFNPYALIPYLYLAITGFFLLQFLVNFSYLIGTIISAPKRRDGNTILVLTTNHNLPYSFLNFIFVDKEQYEDGSILPEVLVHEKAHGEQFHSLDILIIEAVKIFFWFNPVVWLYKQSMQLNHEYLADKHALKDCDLRKYQSTLVNYTYSRQAVSLVSNFNYSFTKKRLMMMTQMKTNKLKFGSKLALLLPVLMIAFLVSATCQTKETPPAKKEMTEEEQVILNKAEDAKNEAKHKVIVQKEKQIQAKEEMIKTKEEYAKQKEVIKKKIILDGDHEEIEKELQELLEGLEDDLEGLDIDIERLHEMEEEINIDVEKIIDGVTKRIKIVSEGFEEDFEKEIEILIEKELGDLDEIIKIKHGDNDAIFIGEDGEVIEIKGHDGHEKKMMFITDDDEVIHINGDDGEKQVIKIIKKGGDDHDIKWIEKHEGHHDHHDHGDHDIRVITDGDVEKKVIIIKDGEEDWSHDIDGDHEKHIEVIVIEDDGKKKKKKKKK